MCRGFQQLMMHDAQPARMPCINYNSSSTYDKYVLWIPAKHSTLYVLIACINHDSNDHHLGSIKNDWQGNTGYVLSVPFLVEPWFGFLWRVSGHPPRFLNLLGDELSVFF